MYGMTPMGVFFTAIFPPEINEQALCQQPQFIPKQYKKDPVTVRIAQDKLENIDRAAAEFGMSRNEFINQCIDYAMEHMQKK